IVGRRTSRFSGQSWLFPGTLAGWSYIAWARPGLSMSDLLQSVLLPETALRWPKSLEFSFPISMRETRFCEYPRLNPAFTFRGEAQRTFLLSGSSVITVPASLAAWL